MRLDLVAKLAGQSRKIWFESGGNVNGLCLHDNIVMQHPLLDMMDKAVPIKCYGRVSRIQLLLGHSDKSCDRVEQQVSWTSWAHILTRFYVCISRLSVLHGGEGRRKIIVLATKSAGDIISRSRRCEIRKRISRNIRWTRASEFWWERISVDLVSS